MPALFDVTSSRAQFPALSLTDSGRNRIYFDNPAGTQVPQQVIDRTVDCLTAKNANLGGYFQTTLEAGDLVDLAHQACADFYNAASASEIVFGQNMTSLTLHMSRCLGRRFRRGDEIVLSRMDHDANVAPWLLLAEDLGLTVRWMDFDTETYEFPDDALARVLSGKTSQVLLTPILMQNLRLQGVMVGSREMFERMTRAFAHHEARPVVDVVFGFDEVPAAFAHLGAGRHFGKIGVAIA